MFDRIGGTLGAAFCGVQAVALGPALACYFAGAEAAGRAWLAWTLPPMIGLGMALVFALPAVGAAMAVWEVFRDG